MCHGEYGDLTVPNRSESQITNWHASVTEEVEPQSDLENQTGLPRALVLSGGSFPTKKHPVHGVFVKERMRFVKQLGIDLRVVSPTPYFPPIKAFGRWHTWSEFPAHEFIDGLEVFRPRYLLLPKLGGYIHAALIYHAARRIMPKIQAEFDFDVIDSHFVYPNGAAAVRLGKRLKKPVVITGRGADIAVFPNLPVIGPQIRAALKQATRLIAVSGEIAERMEELGAAPDKITVIANGVDTEKFSPVTRDEARKRLGLPTDRRIVLGVGYRLELKGFHLLVDALQQVRRVHPDAMVVLVGGQARWAPDYLPQIMERVTANGLEDHVLIAGAKPQDELRYWYSAADVMSINSSREGSPNVLMEALSCGLPAVATPVGGIPAVLSTDPCLGVTIPERTSEAAAAAITQLLSSPIDRERIRAIMQEHSWHSTAKQVRCVFEEAIAEYAQTKRKDS